MQLRQREVLSDFSEYKGSKWIREILSRRDIKPEHIKSSLKDIPNPFKLPDMHKAVDYLLVLKETNEKIVIVTDYDTDGLSSASVLVEGFKSLGFTNVELLVTKRHKNGYGFSLGVVSEINQMDIKPKVIITADLGSSDGNQFKLIPDIDIIVTDHHHISETTPPSSSNVIAFINPIRKDIEHEYSYPVCGAVVAWNLITAINIKLSKVFDVRSLLDLCAVATIGDMMNLTSPINRAIVTYGISMINNSSRVAWQSLKRRLGQDKVFNEEVVGFQISPRINALSRMGDETNMAVQWLLTEDLSDSYELFDKITEINELRKTDQSECETVALKMAKEQVDNGAFICVCFVEEANHGVVGLAAGKISQKLSRPAIVVARTHKGELTGSARSIPGYDIRDAIVRAQNLCGVLKKYGGHSAAAGLSLSTVEELNEFTKVINNIVKEDFNNQAPVPTLKYDIYLPEQLLTETGYKELMSLGPYGQGFDKPTFRVTSKILEIKPLGKEKKHTRLVIERFPYADLIWFNKNFEELKDLKEIDTVVTVSYESFRGRVRFSLLVVS